MSAPSAAPTPSRGTGSNTLTEKLAANKQNEDNELKSYVIANDIGKGSFATVYKGYHKETHHPVAIKTIRKDILTTKLFENLQSEIQILKSLSHRHITKLNEIISAEKNIYLIIEFCAGGDLTNYIKKRGRVEGLEYSPAPNTPLQYYPHPRTGGLDHIVVRSFLRQLARALKFLRQRNLIHRDIKPQNLLLSPASPDELAKGHPIGVPILKVADFGFARSLPNAMMADTLCGSPLYMAPEILRYEKYDAKADLWSVGAVLYEMCVGRAPYRAQNHIDLLKKIEQSRGVKFPDEEPSRTHNAEEIKPVPDDIKALIRMLLKRLPAERASFDDFFKSTALAKSKFPRPSRQTSTTEIPDAGDPIVWTQPAPSIPEHHRIIPPEVLDPQAMIPTSRITFRNGRRESDVSSPKEEVAASPVSVQVKTGSPPKPSSPRPPLSRPLSTEGSVIPGETEEDGFLRREYVLVGDTRAVTFDRAVDEINNAGRRRPLSERKLPTPLSEDALKSDPPPSTSPVTFPPPPNTSTPPPPPLSSSPSRVAANALSRAISLASKKLFGATHTSRRSQDYYTSSSPRRQQIIAVAEDSERDPLEDALLGELEELAQKTDVLTRWADQMYEYVKAVPQKPLPDPAKFEKRDGEAERHAIRRLNADVEAEYNAVTCVSVYMLLMSFAQKGIDKLRNHQEHMKMKYGEDDFVVSEGFDTALGWFREQFIKCNDRAALVKTWLPATYDGPKAWLDQLIYDRALHLSRTAAHKELLDEARSPDECEKLYEESLWCLYALQDDLLQKGNPFLEEDRETISTWIKRTKLRLVRCRARMAMNDRERLQDARVDQNLVDVTRYPAPWDARSDNAPITPPATA